VLIYLADRPSTSLVVASFSPQCARPSLCHAIFDTIRCRRDLSFIPRPCDKLGPKICPTASISLYYSAREHDIPPLPTASRCRTYVSSLHAIHGGSRLLPAEHILLVLHAYVRTSLLSVPTVCLAYAHLLKLVDASFRSGVSYCCLFTGVRSRMMPSVSDNSDCTMYGFSYL
jgi:hypothetical protein